MMFTLLEAGLFFSSSPLRQDVLEEKAQELAPESKESQVG